MEYFIGPKKVECTPIANSASISSGMASTSTAMPSQARNRPIAPTPMMAISAAFTRRMMAALSRRSASCPAMADSRKNGRMNTAEARPENMVSLSAELYTE